MKILYYVPANTRFHIIQLLLLDKEATHYIFPSDNAHDYADELTMRGGFVVRIPLDGYGLKCAAAGFSSYEHARNALLGTKKPKGRTFHGRYLNAPIYRHYIVTREQTEEALRVARLEYTKERLYS